MTPAICACAIGGSARLGWVIVLWRGGSWIAFDGVAPLWARPAGVDRTTTSAAQSGMLAAARGFRPDKGGRLKPRVNRGTVLMTRIPSCEKRGLTCTLEGTAGEPSGGVS